MRISQNKVILDTNFWISYLITKNFSWIDNLLISKHIKLVFSQESLDEFLDVAKRPKFEKYFKSVDLKRLLDLFENYAIYYKITSDIENCRDFKDNFLLSLAVDSKADYLVTGDNDLLILKKVGKTKIITINEFKEKILKTYTL